ncbi:salicylate synthase [Streptomyces sp. NPDC002992]|uniref:salicylate synthase n=1 Tax=Streptomyces sp. NPDC002992 TaxID=3154273 RepID=UPI0033A0FF2D
MSPIASRHYFETQLQLTEDPLLVAARLADSGLHESYVVYENGGNWAYAGGVRAELTLDRTGARLTQEDVPDAFRPWSDQPLRLVSELLGTVTVPYWRAYGWATFELSYAKDGALDDIGDGRLMHLVVPRAEVRFEAGHALLRAADQATLDALLTTVANPGPALDGQPRPLDVHATGGAQYREAVRLAVDEINSGQLHKVILSRVVEVDDDVDLTGTYVAGRRGNNPARSFMLNLGGTEAIGFSPEIVVQVSEDGHVVSQPLAGTRALTGDLLTDEGLRADLFGSPKEVYEHAISVKVGTDELVDVCVEGSVEVPEFMAIKERGSVQHLASRVAGRLAPGREAWDAFGAVFPAVTASGVPKAAAYDSIRRHEPETRGLYSGAVLTVDHTGAMDAALVLRSAYRKDGRTWLRAGAGIVGHSTPEREFEETCEKLDSVARFLVPAGAGAVAGAGAAAGADGTR